MNINKDLTREMTRLIVCPVCGDNLLTVDLKRLTIMCRSCHLDWILSKRIKRSKVGILNLVSSVETRKIINALQNNTSVEGKQ